MATYKLSKVRLPLHRQQYPYDSYNITPQPFFFICTVSFYLSDAYTHSIWYEGDIAISYRTLYEAYMVGNRVMTPVMSTFL